MSTAHRLVAAVAATVLISSCGSAASDQSQDSAAPATAAGSTTTPSVTSLTTPASTIAPVVPATATAEHSTTTAAPPPELADLPVVTTAAAGSLAVSPTSVVVATTQGANVSRSANIPPSLQGLVDQAITDLATRLVVDRASISTLSAEAVVWPDKSLGCPQPGMAYNQVTVDGAVIELSAGGTTYRYHSGGSRSPFLCTKA